ncbi:MAG TPA: AI-2E family transporter [Candidatus Binatia bacterium]|nr:AI-2E family transporter [Candidatus Binatia bacterium]
MNSKRSTIIFLSALVIIVLGLAVVITRPFLKPFAFAIILAVVFYPVHERIMRAMRRRRSLSALLSTLAVLLLFGAPAFIIATLGANEALGAAHYLSRRSAEEGGFTVFLMTLAARPLHFLGHWVDLSKYDLRAIIGSNVQKVSLGMVGFGAAVLGNLARFTVDALITIVILFFLFREGKEWAYRAGRVIPLSEAQVAHLYQNISDTIIANVYGILTVGAAQGVLTGIAMRIVGMPSSLLLGLGAGFASIIPVVGASIVWAPVAIYLLVSGAIWKGVFLLLWGTVVVSSIDNILRPLVVAGRGELHPMVLLFFILGGVEAFGFLGLFLGPVVASVLAAVFAMLREELSEPAEEVSRAGASIGGQRGV